MIIILKLQMQNMMKLKKEILDLEKKYKFLKSKNSPSKSIGYKPSKNFKKFHIKFQCFL